MKRTKETTVELVSWTAFPVETIYHEWQISRTDGPVDSPRDIYNAITLERMSLNPDGTQKWPKGGGPFEAEVRKVFEDCVAMRVPIAETISFVFAIDNMPIALREQWVRHRIGHKYNGDFGFDPVPGIADSSFWSQTFRAKDMGTFATDGNYYEPEWLNLYGDKAMEGHGKVFCQQCGEEANYLPGNPGKYQCPRGHPPFEIAEQLRVRHFWHEQHRWIQAAYRRMCAAGMPLEDARNLLPLGCQHRMTWSTNLAALIHILSKRGCWIAQLGMWEPVVQGIVRELATKVDSYFGTLVNPPCIGADNKFHECKFHKENDEYIKGTDPHHPCPLWLYHHGDRAAKVSEAAENPTWVYDRIDGEHLTPVLPDKDWRFWYPKRGHVTGSVESELADFRERGKKYEQLWRRDPITGERKQVS